jgi:beta-galactosidase
VERTAAVTEVKVYSNAPAVTLEVNGIAMGSQGDPAAGRIFRWPGVKLSPGDNRVRVTARFGPSEASDSCVWTLKPR